MTWFNFNTFNHCPQGRIIVQDITRTMGCQMEALGHKVTHCDGFISGNLGINVLLESFADPADTLPKIQEAHHFGCRFIYVATEEPSPTGFNHGLDPAMIDRQNIYSEAMRYSLGTLHLIPGQHVTDWYKLHGPAAYAELGWSPGLVDPVQFVHGGPDYDIGFFGKMTWRRGQILDKLRAMGLSVLVFDTLDVPQQKRDIIMRTCKVIVGIRGNEEWTTVSSTRCVAALAMGRPIIMEPHPTPDPWDKIVHFAPSMDMFYDDVRLACRISADARRQMRGVQLHRFRELLTPERCIGNALREIGIC